MGGAGFESAIWGWLVSLAGRPLILFKLYVPILGYLWAGWAQIRLVCSLRHFVYCPHLPSKIFLRMTLPEPVLFTVRIIIHSNKPCIWYRLRIIFKTIKLLSAHIVRHQSIWAQLVFKFTTSDIKEVSNAPRTSKRKRRRRMHKRECKNSSLHIHKKHLHPHHQYLQPCSLWSLSSFMHQLWHMPQVPR